MSEENWDDLDFESNKDDGQEYDDAGEETGLEADAEAAAADDGAVEAEEKVSKSKRRRDQRKQATERRHQAEMREVSDRAAYYEGLARGGESSREKEAVEPKPEDYDDPNKYFNDVITYREDKQSSQARQTAPPSAPLPAARDERAFQSFSEAGKDRYGDEFDDMMDAAEFAEFDVSPEMGAAIFSNGETGHDVAMFLFRNPKQATKISRMPKGRQAVEIAKIELKLTPAKNKVSSAPAPYRSGRSASAGKAKSITDKSISTEEYVRLRRKNTK